jgi:hypothetical protein
MVMPPALGLVLLAPALDRNRVALHKVALEWIVDALALVCVTVVPIFAAADHE